MAVATKVMKGIYRDGVIKPLSKIKLPNNLYVTILLSDVTTSNFEDIINSAKETFNSIPSFPNGVNYIKKMRKESELRLKHLLHE